MEKLLIATRLLAFGLALSSCVASTSRIESSPERAYSSEPEVFAEFRTLQKDYFLMLDWRSAGAQETIPTFAARLSNCADRIRELMKKGRLVTNEDRSQAGLILIYDALLTHNNMNAVWERRLPLSQLKQSRLFASAGSDDHAELLARADYALMAIQLAAQLRPQDRRIDSWKVALQAAAERARSGQVTAATFGQSIDAIAARPTFNLWTALLLSRGQHASTREYTRLAAEAKGFVDALRSGRNPCLEHPVDCANGGHAPYNFQSSVAVLGDVFLRKAVERWQAGDRAAAMPLAFYAQGTYKTLHEPGHAADTSTWPDRESLAIREATADRLLRGQLVDEKALIRRDDFLRAYECSACHGRATHREAGSYFPNNKSYAFELK